MKKLNFDELMDLIRTNPDEAEEYRITVIKEYIESLPPERRPRMYRFQHLLDEELRKEDDPMKRLQFVTACMLDSLLEMQDILTDAAPKIGEKLLDLQAESSI